MGRVVIDFGRRAILPTLTPVLKVKVTQKDTGLFMSGFRAQLRKMNPFLL